MDHKDRVLYRLKMIDNLVHKHMDRQIRNNTPELTMMHGWVIGFLYRAKRDIFQRDVEKEFRINRATASGILSLMERKGLIQRSSVSHDARLKKLELTPKGRELHERHMAGLQQVECMVEQALTPPELDTFLILADKIRQALEQ